MFDVGASELLLIVIVAIVVIGPKDLPRAMRLAGQWIAKVRRISGHFRSGIETMIREAELAEMEEKWRAQNEAILKQHPPEAVDGIAQASAEAALPSPSSSQTSLSPAPAPAPVTAVALAEPAKPERDGSQLPPPP
jgi:sec-independent protein translocase protein TatB